MPRISNKSNLNKNTCTKRNPTPPCNIDYIIKENKNGDKCCYKDTKQIKLSKKKLKITIKKDNINKSDSCTKRNPTPPCNDSYIIKENKKGDKCCYKNTKQVKSRKKKYIPQFYNLLSKENDYKYNIPQKFKNMYYATEKLGGDYKPPYINKKILNSNYDQEVIKFIKENNLNVGDILYIGRETNELHIHPGEGFTIVTDKNNFIKGKYPLCGVDVVFNQKILPILKNNKITYKECFEKFKKNDLKYWNYFTEGSESGYEPYFYNEEGLWSN